MSSSSFSEEKSREFSDAAGTGNLRLVESLSRDPEVNLNWQDSDGRTPFFCACFEGHVDTVRYMLDFHDNHLREPIDFNLAERSGVPPFTRALSWGHVEMVEMLLEDDRIDVNLTDASQRTPLWWASHNGHAGIVKRMLASAREIDVCQKDLMEKLTAAELARQKGEEGMHPWELKDFFHPRKKKFFDMAAMIEEYESDPEGVRRQLRRELGFDVRLAGELFGLVVYLSDGYLSLRPEKQAENHQRFFSIAFQLPMDLQMVLCNRVFGVAHSIVKKDHSERGFRKFARGF